MKWFVEVVEFELHPGQDEKEIVKRVDCGTSERKAEKVDDGVNRNLNHDKYFTRIVSQPANV